MLGKLLKNAFSRNSSKSDKKDESMGTKLAVDLKENSGSFVDLIVQKSQEAKDEFFVIKEKLNNLLETNYQLGLKHLQNDHLNEAIFRFRFIKKFWPDHLDSYYQLAYCLALKNKFEKSKKVLEELIAKDPNYGDHVTELLNMMNTNHVEQTQILDQNQAPQEEQNNPQI